MLVPAVHNKDLWNETLLLPRLKNEKVRTTQTDISTTVIDPDADIFIDQIQTVHKGYDINSFSR